MIDRKAFWSMKELSRLFSSIENTEINRRSNEEMRQILFDQSRKWLFDAKFRTVFRILHIKQQSHMIFEYLVKIIEQTKRNSTLQ